jgi:predicted TIM-barrel fold metal-dependent hydrolase
LFPRLRWVFLEIGAEWLVGALGRLSPPARAIAQRCLDNGTLFVSGEPDEDLAYLVKRVGEDVLVGASDYPHADDFRHDPIHEAFSRVGRLSDRLVEKILCSNPRRLYALE